jgi:hypothetical protein
MGGGCLKKTDDMHHLIRTHRIDFFAFNESGLTSNNIQENFMKFQLRDYRTILSPRIIGYQNLKKGGGNGIIFRNSLPVGSHRLHPFYSSEFECQLVQIFETADNHSCQLVNIYRRPAHYNISLFSQELDRLLLALESCNTGFVLLMGDINAPDPRNDGQVHPAVLNVFLRHGIHQWIDKPTRGRRLLDVIASPDNQTVSSVDVIEPLESGSDHKRLIASLNLRK